VGEASPESATYLLTAVAAGFVLLNGDGDVITAHRLLTQAIEDQARPYRISDTGVGRPGGRRAQGNRANPTPRRSASIRLAHAAGTPDRAAGRRRPDQQGDRPAAFHVTPDGRSPPVPDLSQTWHNHPGSAARRARLPALRAPRRESQLTVTSKNHPAGPGASEERRGSGWAGHSRAPSVRCAGAIMEAGPVGARSAAEPRSPRCMSLSFARRRINALADTPMTWNNSAFSLPILH